LENIPLFVKAGSIVPMGPVVQHSGLNTLSELEIRVYAGANGQFTLYEDEGDNYNYENGQFSTIGFIWDDAQKELTIGHREGAFKGVLSERKFKLVYFTDELNKENAVMRIVDYSGKRMGIKL
jgi:alpha-D-xyloside xylohydrolase